MADRLSRDSSAAIACGMSYGQYMERLYETGQTRPVEPTKILEGMIECQQCGKAFDPNGKYKGTKYCSRTCSIAVAEQRNRIRCRNRYRRKVGLPIDTE